MTVPDVYAAGGVIVRGPAETPEVVLVHRQRYDDWALPKGKADPGETPEETALREVEEETGLTCRIVGHAGTVEYPVSEGNKRVDYYLMRPVRARPFRPNQEVDLLTWLPLDAATRQATYDFDRRLLDQTQANGQPPTSTIHLVRHGAAGDREEWQDDDRLRPLTPKGHRQAAALVDALTPLKPATILSSPYTRCVQTVEPLAERLGLEVVADPALEEGPVPSRLSELLDRVAGTDAVLCSHGDVIPALLRRLQHLGVHFLSPFECRKGSTWAIGHGASGYTDARYFPPPAV